MLSLSLLAGAAHRLAWRRWAFSARTIILQGLKTSRKEREEYVCLPLNIKEDRRGENKHHGTWHKTPGIAMLLSSSIILLPSVCIFACICLLWKTPTLSLFCRKSLWDRDRNTSSWNFLGQGWLLCCVPDSILTLCICSPMRQALAPCEGREGTWEELNPNFPQKASLRGRNRTLARPPGLALRSPPWPAWPGGGGLKGEKGRLGLVGLPTLTLTLTASFYLLSPLHALHFKGMRESLSYPLLPQQHTKRKRKEGGIPSGACWTDWPWLPGRQAVSWHVSVYVWMKPGGSCSFPGVLGTCSSWWILLTAWHALHFATSPYPWTYIPIPTAHMKNSGMA